ncbi:MAG TPA: uroporphyrinogen-III C-methyltransferase [Candidatus Binataceae bacterium]|nr:uroporphyrinogen-III C-methyltransferase [Candidatus Binataceae bacterium]
MAERAGKVYLVGAGPGAPDLITLRAERTLRRAEVVIHDSLVSPELLLLAPQAAELIYAGKRAGAPGNIDQAELNRLMIEHARAGRRVVRLKGGDPFIFGRGGEEAEALSAAGVEFEVVPGVTSAIAAPAFAGIPLTHRRAGSFVAFLTAHLDGLKRADGGGAPLDELAAAARKGGTLVLLMARARLRETLARLTAAGLAAETPAAIVQWASVAAHRALIATLATLADEAERANVGAPAVVVVGETAAMGKRLGWFERMPLFGRRIVVTRARSAASAFANGLRAMGAEVIEFPTIETVAPDSYAEIDAALARLDSFDWVIFTSATGVERFVDRMRERGVDVRAMAGAKLAAIGPATAARLAARALTVAAQPLEYRAEAILDAIGGARLGGARILIPRAQVAREVLPAMLREAGAREVIVAPVYKTVAPARAPVERVRALAAAGAIDLVAFTSSSTVTNFCAMVGEASRGLPAAVIGPITAASAREAGLKVVVEAPSYTVPALIEAMRDYLARSAG